MDETQPPEIGLQLVARGSIDVRNEFIRLFKKCLASRSYGLEHRMDHNRDLSILRTFMREKGHLLRDKEHPAREINFDLACDWLDYSPDDARRRIARAQTWDMIRNYLESNGSSARMPGTEAHVDALFSVGMEKRGPAWSKFYDAAIAARLPITAGAIRAWLADYDALPVESTSEPAEINFEDESEDESEEEAEISQEDVPQGTKPAVAVEVPPTSPPLTQTPGEGPLFKHPPKVKEAIEKIVEACGGDDPARRAEWRKILSDPVKIEFQSLLDWAKYDKQDIRRIAALATGNLHKGLRTAMRIVAGVIDSRTTLNFLVNRCRAEGGRLEHVHGPYTIVVTYQESKDYET